MRAAALTARTADRHALYERSVQDPPTDIVFIDKTFRKRLGRRPRLLREDFCGTGLMASHWVRQQPTGQAIGLDLHQPTMTYGEKTHLAPLGALAKQVSLRQRNVLDGAGLRNAFDVVVAFNFSYCALTQRQMMLSYFRRVLQELKPGGGFFMDVHGGTEVFEEMTESTRHRGFTYIWDQEPYDVVGGLTRRHIHFRFADGSELKRAFSYAWRLWTLVELRDLMQEAGFATSEVFWEGDDGKGEGNGVFRRVRRAHNEAAWIAYLVGWKKGGRA